MVNKFWDKKWIIGRWKLRGYRVFCLLRSIWYEVRDLKLNRYQECLKCDTSFYLTPAVVFVIQWHTEPKIRMIVYHQNCWNLHKQNKSGTAQVCGHSRNKNVPRDVVLVSLVEKRLFLENSIENLTYIGRKLCENLGKLENVIREKKRYIRTLKTLHPTIGNLLSEFKYVLDVMWENFSLSTFTVLKNFPRNGISGIRYTPKFVIHVLR